MATWPQDLLSTNVNGRWSAIVVEEIAVKMRTQCVAKKKRMRTKTWRDRRFLSVISVGPMLVIGFGYDQDGCMRARVQLTLVDASPRQNSSVVREWSAVVML